MTPFTFLDIIAVFKQIVMFNSHLKPCMRLNGLVVIDDKFNWDNDSFEAKSRKDFYFSRDQQKLLFPVLAISIDNHTLGDFKNQQYRNFCHAFALGVVDQKVIDCINCDDCDKRNEIEIYNDVSILLRKVLNIAAKIKLFKLTKGVTDKYLYSVQEVVDVLIGAGTYDSYRVVMSETSVIELMWGNNNSNLILNEIPITKMNTLGMWTNLTMCEFCNDNEMEFVYKKYANQNCC